MVAHQTVPRTTQVVPGAPVNIVLKADQRTGRQVSGLVRDVLTRGDHPRGIKVRLADGRIGRVQSMAPAAPDAGYSYDQGPSREGALPDHQERPAPPRAAAPRPRGQHPRYRDVREDEPLEAPAEQADLAAYIVPAKQRKPKGRKQAATAAAGGGSDSPSIDSHPAPEAADVATATSTCPVCNAFEGDEAAVAHHVAGHFD